MLELSTVFKHTNDVRYRVIGDEAVVVRQSAAEVIALNDVGARVLELLETGRSLGALIEALSVEYDVERDVLARDIEAFLSELESAGVIEATPEAEAR